MNPKEDPNQKEPSNRCEFAYTAINIHEPPYQIDIICNGFSLYETILSVIQEGEWLKFIEQDKKLAQDITDALATKLKLKQG